jgi:hypothetical protein
MQCVRQLRYLRIKPRVRVVPEWRAGRYRKLLSRWAGGPLGPLFVPLNLVAK